MLEAILPLSLERVVVSGKSIAQQDTDVITFAKDLFFDTHLASSPESEKRNVLCEKISVQTDYIQYLGKIFREEIVILENAKNPQQNYATKT